MKRIITCAAVAAVLAAFSPHSRAADSGHAYGKKRVGGIERVKAMAPVGTVRKAPAGTLAAAAGYSKINGSMLFTGSTRLQDRRVYTIDLATGAMTMLDTPEVFATGGGVLAGDRYYCMTRLKIMRLTQTKLYVYNPDTWELIDASGLLDETLNATDMAYDPTTGRVFGCFFNGDGNWVMGTIDFESRARTELAACPQLNALAADEAGKLYAIDMEGALYSVDKDSGLLSRIGDTGIKAAYRNSYWQGSAVFDPVSGQIIYSAHSSAAANPSDDDFIGAIWAIDPATAASSQVRHLSGEELFDGLYIPREPLIDEVPAAPTDLAADFPGGALSGTLSFRMPQKLVGGMNAGSGMTYTAKANGAVVGSGQAAAGELVSLQLTLEAGNYCFTVTASNSEGSSREASLIAFIGVDRPARPKLRAAFDYATSTVSLSWDPVRFTSSGTALPDGSVTYRVTRYPERTVVAEALTATSFSETLPAGDLRAINYHVEAVADGLFSGAAISPDILVGSVTPYFSEDFRETDRFRYFTVVDSDGDRLTWHCSPIDAAAKIAWDNNADPDTRKDDWLLSPPMSLKAGQIYVLSYGARKLYDEETLTVAMGGAPTAEAMTKILVPATQIANDRAETHTLDITVEADGVYFFGFHATSPRNSGALYISQFSVAEGVIAGAPAAVKAMEVVPAEDRSHAATINFTAPDTAMDGSALASLAGVDVYRDGQFVATAQAAPGAQGSYTDTGAHQGVNVYTLRARNDAGTGSPTERQAFIGWDEPNRVERVRARELETAGTVEVTWTAPRLDNNNSPLTVEALRYDVFMSATLPSGKTETTQVGADVKGTTHSVTVCGPEERRFAEFYVIAKTEGGSARDVWTPDIIPVGKAYDIPFAESFGNARFENFWGVYNDYVFGSTGLAWTFSDDYTYDITSQDSDNGFLVLEGQAAGDASEIYSSKINLAGAKNPALTFYSYNIKGTGSDDINYNRLTISAYDGTEKIVVAEVSMSDYNEDGWQRVTVPLSGLEGKTVQLLIKGTIDNYLTIALDNIRVAATLDRNLAAETLSAPGKVLLNKKYYVYATVRNTGLEEMQTYTLDFYRDETKLESRNGRALASGEAQTHEFEIYHDLSSNDFAEYWCKLTATGDEDPSDDTSKRSRVKVCVPNYPAVTTLACSDLGDTPKLVWNEPDLSSSEPFEIVEDFESYPAFANSGLADWVLYDRDQAYIGGIEDANEGDIELPGIPTGSQQSWFVLDGDYEKLNFTYRSNSGHQHIATMYCYGLDHGIGYETANDDWLISPVLAPGSSEISFFARGYSNMTPDALEVLVTTDNGPEPLNLSYRSLGKVDPMPTTWEEYYVELPAGTKRFAIRSVGNFGFMLFVDDITFTPASGASMLSIKGYNVYRDGVKINDEPLVGREYTDAAATGIHQYGVTVVYNRGESRMSNIVSLTSAVEQVGAAAGVRVSAANGCIVVEGAAGEAVSVYGTDGREIYSTASAAATLRVSVPAGIYLVRAASTSAKVAVK